MRSRFSATSACFSIASGYSVESWLKDGQAVGTGGIANPQPTRLLTGHYHYRFASSSARRTSQLGGGWWLDFENFKLVQRFAADNGYTLREAARLMMALMSSAGKRMK